MERNPILEATNQNISPNTTQTTNQSQNQITMIAQFNKFKKELRNSGKNPQQIVQELLSSGKMSNKQFEELSARANALKNFLK